MSYPKIWSDFCADAVLEAFMLEAMRSFIHVNIFIGLQAQEPSAGRLCPPNFRDRLRRNSHISLVHKGPFEKKKVGRLITPA